MTGCHFTTIRSNYLTGRVVNTLLSSVINATALGFSFVVWFNLVKHSFAILVKFSLYNGGGILH